MPVAVFGHRHEARSRTIEIKNNLNKLHSADHQFLPRDQACDRSGIPMLQDHAGDIARYQGTACQPPAFEVLALCEFDQFTDGILVDVVPGQPLGQLIRFASGNHLISP